MALAKQKGFAGIGFVFTKDDPYTGIDLDGVRDPATGAIQGWAWATIQGLGSYAEVSPYFLPGRETPFEHRRHLRWDKMMMAVRDWLGYVAPREGD